MSFHLGKPILVMVIAALIGGIIVFVRPPTQHAKMVYWLFAESHKRAYAGDGQMPGESSAARYQRISGNSLDIVLMNVRAEDVRLVSLFNTHGKDQLVADAAEVEISRIGKFFRPPVADVGFLPLNDFLHRSGWYDELVHARFSPWSKQGVIFGVPLDLHPTTITFRKDLFDQAGVDLASADTWEKFRLACLQFRHYWNDQGRPRWPAGFSRANSDNLMILLQQRHVNLVDDENHIFLNNPKVADTVRKYSNMVAGPDPVGTDFDPAPGLRYRDLANGEVCAMFTPDWETGYLKHLAPDAAGKMAMMPLPRFEPGDSPTASWGGTMVGIPRDCRDPEASWKLIEALCLSHEAIAYRRQTDQIIPPIRKYWSDDVYQAGDPYFQNNQKINRLYIEMAEQLPERYVTPFTLIAQQLLADVLNKTVARIDSQRLDHLDEDIQQWLNIGAVDLDRRMKFGTFED